MQSQSSKKTVQLGMRVYANYAARSRVLIGVDGLIMARRRMMYAASNKLGLTSSKNYRKTTSIIGETTKYHPHGDASIKTMIGNTVRGRNALLSGQGNWGSWNSVEAAPRYTEVRPSPLFEELYYPFDRRFNRFQDSYDGEDIEPVIYNTKIPCLFLNDHTGLGVGLTSRIPSLSVKDIAQATLEWLKGEPIHEFQPDYEGALISSSSFEVNAYKFSMYFRPVLDLSESNRIKVMSVCPKLGLSSLILSESLAQLSEQNLLTIQDLSDASNPCYVLFEGNSYLLEKHVLPKLVGRESYRINYLTLNEKDEFLIRENGSFLTSLEDWKTEAVKYWKLRLLYEDLKLANENLGSLLTLLVRNVMEEYKDIALQKKERYSVFHERLTNLIKSAREKGSSSFEELTSFSELETLKKLGPFLDEFNSKVQEFEHLLDKYLDPNGKVLPGRFSDLKAMRLLLLNEYEELATTTLSRSTSSILKDKFQIHSVKWKITDNAVEKRILKEVEEVYENHKNDKLFSSKVSGSVEMKKTTAHAYSGYLVSVDNKIYVTDQRFEPLMGKRYTSINAMASFNKDYFALLEDSMLDTADFTIEYKKRVVGFVDKSSDYVLLLNKLNYAICPVRTGAELAREQIVERGCGISLSKHVGVMINFETPAGRKIFTYIPFKQMATSSRTAVQYKDLFDAKTRKLLANGNIISYGVVPLNAKFYSVISGGPRDIKVDEFNIIEQDAIMVTDGNTEYFTQTNNKIVTKSATNMSNQFIQL